MAFQFSKNKISPGEPLYKWNAEVNQIGLNILGYGEVCLCVPPNIFLAAAYRAKSLTNRAMIVLHPGFSLSPTLQRCYLRNVHT